jgi:hypothetical protein
MKTSALVSRTVSHVVACVAGIAGTLLVLEGALRVLPVLSGTYAADPRASWPIHTMIPNTHYTYSTGWNLQNIHRGRINNFGYAAPADYERGHGGVAVFGDSYVESLMNDYSDTLQGTLNDFLKTPRRVMSFGMSGAEMPDYLGTADLVRREFAPEWAVFVITLGDFTRGFSAAPGYFEWRQDRSPPIELVPEIRRSELSKWLRTVAVIRYLRGNLSMRPGELISLQRGSDTAAGTARCVPEVLSKKDEALLAAFARELPRAAGLPPQRVILVFDSDRKAIYAGKTAAERQGCPQRATLANDRLKQLAAGGGLHVIDSDPVFRRHFSAGLGPVDRSPIDAHWNPAAHRLMAREVALVIEPAQF